MLAIASAVATSTTSDSEAVANEDSIPNPQTNSITIIDPDKEPIPYLYTDYNKDGVLDVIRKEADNKIYVYINKATNQAPVYEPGVLYVGAEPDFPVREKLSAGSTAASTDEMVYIGIYPRFDLYVREDYYNANKDALDAFFVNFNERYQLLEQTTGWTSEKAHGTKLRINLNNDTVSSCCGGGFNGGTKITTIIFSNPLYMQGCQSASRENGTWRYDNPGELGNWWPYMEVVIHEVTHAINPRPILYERWLTEGFATYNEFNILTQYGDINQETSDYFIYVGSNFFNWDNAYGYYENGYSINDYHDTTSQEAEIQNSYGYYITGEMLSMLRKDHNLNWQNFYNIVINNYETLDKAKEFAGPNVNLTDYHTDTAVIDMFGKALGKSFNEIKTIFQYAGPLEPGEDSSRDGWGVRHFTDLNWYADLVPTTLTVSNTMPKQNTMITITTRINNNGQTNTTNVPVKIYNGGRVIDERIVNVSAGGYIILTKNYVIPTGNNNLKVVVDPNNIKIETNDLNNQKSLLVQASNQYCSWQKTRTGRIEYVCAIQSKTTSIDTGK